MSSLSQAPIELRDIERAAHAVAASALQLRKGEKVVLFCDASSRELADALVTAARDVGAQPIVADLDLVGERPHKLLPDAWSFALALANASVFVASAPHDELAMRQHLLHLVAAHRLRHAHMPAISRRAFTTGIRGGQRRLALVGARILRALEAARGLDASSVTGTELHVSFGPPNRWFAQLGLLQPGLWGNLPAGALYTSPRSVDGVFVANASVGEFFGAREGLLARAPVRFTIEKARVVDVSAPHSRQLERDIEAMLAASPNSDRVGLVAVGVNDAIPCACGESLVDQNLPGLHLSIGDPAARVTGARWSAPTSFAVCASDGTVVADGVPLVRSGRIVD